MITTDLPPTDDEETRTRMRLRFQEIDERRRKRAETKGAWAFVCWIGFAILFAGFLMMMVVTGYFAFSIELLLVYGIILVGAFFVAIALFLRSAGEYVIDDRRY